MSLYFESLFISLLNIFYFLFTYTVFFYFLYQYMFHLMHTYLRKDFRIFFCVHLIGYWWFSGRRIRGSSSHLN